MVISIAICICTRDRPESLRICLKSIVDQSVLPDQVLVSDDSSDPTETSALCTEFSFVTYMEGPKRGLCANRNRVIAAAHCSHISLIDDDGVLAKEFVARAFEHAQRESPTMIITGSVLEFGSLLFHPGSPDIWGNFTQKPGSRGYETIQLNCNLFPRAAFDIARFDELIQYGFEDMDLCSHLLSEGYTIKWDPCLVNSHHPPVQNHTMTVERFRLWEQARYYTSLKRYVLWKRRPLLGILYACSAPFYTMAFSAKWKQWARIPNAPADMLIALRLFARFIKLSK